MPGSCADDDDVLFSMQVVVHGIPWSFDDQQLMAIFTDRIPSTQIESAEVVYGRDSRSRVRNSPVYKSPTLAPMITMGRGQFTCETCQHHNSWMQWTIFKATRALSGGHAFSACNGAWMSVGQGYDMQGYGTVKFLSSEDAQLAIQECDGLELQGRLLSVKLDQWG